MKGFDHDDPIQQAVALLVLATAAVAAFVVGPANKIAFLLLFGVGAIASLWYLFIAKGLAHPLGFVKGFRDIFKYLTGRNS